MSPPFPSSYFVLRNKDVFGEDADKFNPERWLDGSLQDKATTKLGVYGNLCVNLYFCLHLFDFRSAE
jgi:hypothetical protein